MIYLIVVSLIWAFSFGIIKNYLAGLDPAFISFIRSFLALISFLPFLKPINNNKVRLKLILIGAVQFGAMYLFYIASMQYLKAYQAAFFTIFTPFYIAIIDSAIKKNANIKAIIASVFAILGSAVLVYKTNDYSNALWGFLLMQASNFCFASGQIFYKKVADEEKFDDKNNFALLYLGASLITLPFCALNIYSSVLSLQFSSIIAILYLAFIASGLSFFLWNKGARITEISKVAVINNLKIPLGALVSIFIFSESADWLRLSFAALSFVFAFWLSEKLNLNSKK